jgi:outer membrane scaffolding protein for murein synthesis (MipA/OmpV family)
LHRGHRFGRALTAALALCIAGAAHAQTLPRWEVGIGLGVLSLPYYRGADSGRAYILPFPYLVYRGRHLRVDDDGIRGYVFHSERIKLDFSLAAGVPVPSTTNSVRRGMPDLDSTAEFGPSLEVLLWQRRDQARSLRLKLPVRAAFSVGWGKVDHQGWVFAPSVEYSTRRGTAAQPWIFGLSGGPLFADRAYHDYFYEVAAPYATATRPEYHPDAGYSGSRVTVTAQKQWGNYWLGLFVRYDNLQGAAFSDSPLVQRRDYLAMGAGITKLLAVSKAPEEHP